MNLGTAGPSQRALPSDRTALSAVALMFFVNGATFASFMPRLPEIRDQVGVDNRQIGLALSLAGAAGLVGSLVASPALTRFGTRRTLAVGGAVLSLSLPLIGLAGRLTVLLGGLATLMVADVVVDIAMNLQGSWLSARRAKPVMSRLHGLWSLGTVVGGLSSSRLSAAGISLAAHLCGAAAVLLAVTLVVARNLLPTDESPAPAVSPAAATPASTSRAPKGYATPLALLFAAGFVGVAMESSSTDWAAFRLRDDFHTTGAFAVLGFVAVTTGMMVGRFSGDALTVRLGRSAHTTLSTVAAAIGFTVAAFAPDRWLTIAGYLITGLGVAGVLPALYNDAAQRPGRPGAGLGALTAGLRTASLTVPLVIGSLAASGMPVGRAVALVALPSVAAFGLITVLNKAT